MTDIELIEHLHKRRLIPDWAYYQLNGRDIAANYRDQLLKRQEERELEEYRSRRKAEIEEDIQRQIEKELPLKIRKAIAELFNGYV